MTTKIKERLLNASISALTAGGAVVLAFTLSSGETKDINIEKELKEKAPYEYVNTHDAIIQKNLDDYKDDHQIQHSVEMQSVDKRLEQMMDFWGIKKE